MTIYSHGNEFSIKDSRKDKNGKSLGLDGLIKLVKDSGWEEGMKINLKSCNTGTGEDPIGKQLSKALNTKVSASDGYIQYGLNSYSRYRYLPLTLGAGEVTFTP